MTRLFVLSWFQIVATSLGRSLNESCTKLIILEKKYLLAQQFVSSQLTSNSLKMISAALSPITRAVLYVFAPTLDGIMDRSRISETHGRPSNQLLSSL